MSDLKERSVNDQQLTDLVELATGKHQPAREYLLLLARFARLCDDLIDRDWQVTPKETEEMVGILFVQIPSNGFYQANFAMLQGMHFTLWNAYLDSNILANGDALDRVYAHVLRDMINEVVPMVAFVLYGYKHMRKVSEKMRKIFRKNL